MASARFKLTANLKMVLIIFRQRDAEGEASATPKRPSIAPRMLRLQSESSRGTSGDIIGSVDDVASALERGGTLPRDDAAAAGDKPDPLAHVKQILSVVAQQVRLPPHGLHGLHGLHAARLPRRVSEGLIARAPPCPQLKTTEHKRQSHIYDMLRLRRLRQRRVRGRWYLALMLIRMPSLRIDRRKSIDSGNTLRRESHPFFKGELQLPSKPGTSVA